MKVWHITPKKNISSILCNGLVPKIGPRSRSAKETVPLIYVFPDSLAMMDALDNWLNDEFPETTCLSILEIDVLDELVVVHPWRYENSISVVIPPENIRILVVDIDNWCGSYPGENIPHEWFEEIEQITEAKCNV